MIDADSQANRIHLFILRPKDYQECNSWPTHARELPQKERLKDGKCAPTHGGSTDSSDRNVVNAIVKPDAGII